MNSLVTGDWHFSDNPRDDYRHAYMKKLMRLIKRKKVNNLIVLGDLTEEKDRHSAWLVNQVVLHFAELSQLCKIYILRGNHDYVDPDTPFFSFLGHF